MEKVIEEARRAAAAAAERAGVTVREVHDPRECEELVAVLNDVWGTDVDIIDHAFLTALAHAGCYVAAAFRQTGSDDGGSDDAARPGDSGTGSDDARSDAAHAPGEAAAEMVGAGVAFFGAEPGVIHSHVLGARPGQASRGVGQAVKAHSRLWCLEHGVTTMRWTYDPLQSLNTYLNLHVFGAELADFVDDFYGDLHDGLNEGVPTDRAVLAWDVAHPRAPLTDLPDHLPGDPPVALGRAGIGPGTFHMPDGARALTAIPESIDDLRRDHHDVAVAWALANREAVHALRGAGWAPRDATKDGWVVWERKP